MKKPFYKRLSTPCLNTLRFTLSIIVAVDGWIYFSPIAQVRAQPEPVTHTLVTPGPAPNLPDHFAEAPLVSDFQQSPIAEDTLPIYSRIPTSAPVVFLTIDDGVFKPEDAAQFMVKYNLPASLFLNNSVISNNYEYFRGLVQSSSAIENHTVHHSHLTRLPFEKQRDEICADSDLLNQAYGQRPTLFRPPYGQYNSSTLKAAKDCGLQALVLWSVVIEKGTIQYQTPHTSLEPGDIVLLRFRPELLSDLQAFQAEAEKAHLQVALLEDWLQ